MAASLVVAVLAWESMTWSSDAQSGGAFRDAEIPPADDVGIDLKLQRVTDRELVEPGATGVRLRDAVIERRDSGLAERLGWAYFDRHQWNEANQWFQSALAWDSNHARAAEGLILTTYRSGDSHKAYQLSRQYEKLVPDGRATVVGAIDAQAWRLIESGRFNEAEKSISGFPADETGFVKAQQEIARHRMNLAVARGDYGQARQVAGDYGIGSEEVSKTEAGDLLLRASKAQKEGEYRESLDLVTQAERLTPLDRDARKIKAWNLYHTRRFDESAGLFQSLYRQTPDKDSAEGLTYSLQQSGRVHDLSQLSGQLGGPLKETADPVLAAAAKQEAERQRREREAQLAAAEAEAARLQAQHEAQLREAHPAYAPPPPTVSANGVETGLTPVNGPPPPPGYLPRAEGATSLPASSVSALNPLQDISAERRLVPETSHATVGASYGGKSGDPGLGRLRVTQLPSASGTLVFGPNDNQSISAGARLLWLDAGDLTGDRLVGSAPVGSTLDRGKVTTSTDTLVEPRLAYRIENQEWGYFAELGTTPLGGEVSARPVGVIGAQWEGQDANWRIEGYSESVRESILSYTGIADPFTGKDWGRVTRSGVRTDGWASLGNDWGVYGQLGLNYLGGENVEDNSSFTGTIGVSRNLNITGFEYLSIGPSLNYQAFDKNLSGFTTGHGGYFSPESLIQAMMGMSFLTETGRSWMTHGFLGVGGQSHDQAASPVLPFSSKDTRFYDASSESSVVFTARLHSLFELSQNWRLGTQAGYSKTAGYEDFGVALYLSYLFQPESGLDLADLPWVW